MKNKGYTIFPLDFTRKMVIASVRGNKKNAIHLMTEVDITNFMDKRRLFADNEGVTLSVTACIVKSFAETLKEFPDMNSFIKGRRLVVLDDVNISVLIERELKDQKVPEPLGIQKVQDKTCRELHDEIRKAQENASPDLGSLSGFTWVKWIPGFLLRLFIRMAERNIAMAKRYGKVAVTAIGMNAAPGTWVVPHGTATVLLAIGSMIKRNVMNEKGEVEKRTYLCVTGSFDHEIVDGSPAARFMKRFEEIFGTGAILAK